MTGPHRAAKSRRSLAALSALLLVCVAHSAVAQVGGQAPSGGGGGASASAFAGSMVSFRNQVSAPSFDRSALPTYNPNVSLAMLVAPRLAIGKGFSLSGMITLTQELTNSDWTSKRDETTLSDTFLTLGRGLWASEALGLGLSASLQLRLPTSKPSLANSLMLGTAAGLTLSWSRAFAPLGWAQRVSVALIGRGGPMLHRYSTGSLASPWLVGCTEQPGGCAMYSHDGERNPELRWQGIVAVDWSPLPKLSLSASAGVFYDQLPAVTAATARAGFVVPADSTDPSARGIVFTAFYANYQFHPGFSLALGSETAQFQLAPDSTYRQPFFNQFTTFLVAFRTFPDAIVASLRGG